MEIPAIEMQAVDFAYDRVPILEDVSLTLDQRDFLAIMGPNGGGKTTLAKLLLGLLRPSRGRIRVLGEPPEIAKRRVGYVPQNTSLNLSFPIATIDVALMGRLGRSRLGRWYSHADREKVEAILKTVGLWDLAYAPVGTLSGGQRQRLFIARALVGEPELLILDEPTANVDPEFELDIFEFLRDLNRDITIVMITHDVGVISRYVKSVACVNRTLMFHGQGQITAEMLSMGYQCPVDLVAHGLPHRVLPEHEKEK